MDTTKNDEQGITRFQMEMRYFLEKTIYPLLANYYGEITAEWGDYEVDVETGDGYYDGIVIRIQPSNYEVYKKNRRRSGDRIYQWFGGSIKTIRGDRQCDNPQEYQWLMHDVVYPIQKIVEGMEMEMVTRDYVDETEVYRVTGVTKVEHDKLTRAVDRFAAGIREVYGYIVHVEKTGYFTAPNYLGYKTVWVHINKGEDVIIFDYSARTGLVTELVQDEDVRYTHSVLFEVAKQVIKTRGYTKFNHNRLREEAKIVQASK